MSEENIEQPAVEEQPLVTGGPEDNIGEAEVVEPEASVEATAEKPPENIRIGEKSFATQQEAWDYADKLAQERLAQDAYRQGMDDALRTQSQVTQEQAPAQEDDFDEQFYSDPKGYLQKYGEQIANSVKTELETKQQTAQREKELWNKFYTDNPDLQVKERLVKSILQDNWDVLSQMKDSNEALKILASKTRSELKSWAEADKPQTELPRTATQVSAGKGGQVTQQSQPDKPVDFLSQINQHQKGRLI